MQTNQRSFDSIPAGPFKIENVDSNRLLVHRSSPAFTCVWLGAIFLLGAYLAISRYDGGGIWAMLDAIGEGHAVFGPIFILMVAVTGLITNVGFRLEIDRASGTVTYEVIRAYRIERTVRPLSDIVEVALPKKKLGVYWGGSIIFADDVWLLVGGAMWSLPISFGGTQAQLEFIKQYSEFRPADNTDAQ
ncbi:MAG: hypothetical protein AAF986_04300 [Pseudomonadota bacterium]